MSTRPIHLGTLFIVMFFTGCTDESPLCDAAALQEALESATSGQTIRVGSCSITGAFVIPEGVTLAGVDQASSTVIAESDEPALRLLPGDAPTRVEDLSVSSDERIAVLTMGPGRAELSRVDVEATRGIAFGAEALTELTLDTVDLSGPISDANATSVSPSATFEDTAIIGALIASVDSATMTQVTASGFASFGVIAVETDILWQGGGAPRNLGSGVAIYGGSAELQGLSLGETFQGLLPLTIAGVFAAGATLESSDLIVNDSEGLGLLHDDVTAHHTDLQASHNADVALWVQRCPSFELSGSMSELTSNRYSGIALFETDEAQISGARIAQTIAGPMMNGDLGSVTVGDGVQAISPGSSLVLRNVELYQNERVGALLDLNESDATLTLEEVSVDGTDDQYGVIAQGRDPVTGWDDGVLRSGSTEENDEALATPLPTISLRFTDAFPGAEIIVEQGVAGIIGDCGSY